MSFALFWIFWEQFSSSDPQTDIIFGVLSDILSGILYRILTGLVSDIFSDIQLSGTLSGSLPDIYADSLPGTWSEMHCDILLQTITF